MKSTSFRFVVFLFITAFIFLGPAYRQVLGGQEKIFRKWVMWSGQGLGILDIKLYGINGNNKEEFINFKSSLRENYSDKQYRRFRKIRTRKELLEVLSLICQKSDYSQINMNLRKATRNGWKTIYERKLDLCKK